MCAHAFRPLPHSPPRSSFLCPALFPALCPAIEGSPRSSPHALWSAAPLSHRPNFPSDLAALPLEEQYKGLTSSKKQAGLTPEERASFTQLLETTGAVDTFRALHPSAHGVFSFFSARFPALRQMNKGLRLDYVIASQSLCSGLQPQPDVVPLPLAAAAAATADAAEVAETAAAPSDASSASASTATAATPALPFIQDSFILDQAEPVSDHVPVGFHLYMADSLSQDSPSETAAPAKKQKQNTGLTAWLVPKKTS